MKMWREITIAVMIASILGLFQFTYSISNRLTRAETTGIFVNRDIQEIKADVKELLKRMPK